MFIDHEAIQGKVCPSGTRRPVADQICAENRKDAAATVRQSARRYSWCSKQRRGRKPVGIPASSRASLNVPDDARRDFFLSLSHLVIHRRRFACFCSDSDCLASVRDRMTSESECRQCAVVSTRRVPRLKWPKREV
jgi:hypothetical protein